MRLVVVPFVDSLFRLVDDDDDDDSNFLFRQKGQCVVYASRDLIRKEIVCVCLVVVLSYMQFISGNSRNEMIVSPMLCRGLLRNEC